MKEIRVKNWFLEKNLNEQERYAVSVSDLAIERETPKAILIGAYSDFGKVTFWCPKSCLMSEEEIKTADDRILNGFRYNELLTDYAKQSKVKGIRKGLKTSTLKAKIEEAGLKVPTFEELCAVEEADHEAAKEEVKKLNIGDKVSHKKFGDGVVVKIHEMYAEVRFNDDTKTICATFLIKK
jgi:hypothetical protein